MRRGVKAAAWALFALYGLIMLWLLFIRGRQPEMMSTLRTNLILAFAFMESLTIYGLVIAFILIGKM